MNLSGNVGSSPRISAPSAPPSPARPEPTAKVSEEDAVDVDAEAARRRAGRRPRRAGGCRSACATGRTAAPSVSAAQTTMMNSR